MKESVMRSVCLVSIMKIYGLDWRKKMYNGVYGSKLGRPVSDVEYLRKALREAEQAEMNTPEREVLQCNPQPETETSVAPTAQSLLDDLDFAISLLNERVLELQKRIEPMLGEPPEPYPIPGPRVATSPLTQRIAASADNIDNIKRMIGDIIDRTTL